MCVCQKKKKRDAEFPLTEENVFIQAVHIPVQQNYSEETLHNGWQRKSCFWQSSINAGHHSLVFVTDPERVKHCSLIFFFYFFFQQKDFVNHLKPDQGVMNPLSASNLKKYSVNKKAASLPFQTSHI